MGAWDSGPLENTLGVTHFLSVLAGATLGGAIMIGWMGLPDEAGTRAAQAVLFLAGGTLASAARITYVRFRRRLRLALDPPPAVGAPAV